MSKPWTVIVTCEHASRALPPEWVKLFRERGIEPDLHERSVGGSPETSTQCGQTGLAPLSTLEEHRWWDPGAKIIASALGSRLLCPIFLGHYTRLLIDLNRSPENPQRWSEITQSLRQEEKKLIEDTCYWPYWNRVHQTVAHKLSAGNRVLHLSIHSFTPVLNGAVRTMDMGLLLDPSRESETSFCESWSELLTDQFPGMAIAFNEPYRGTDDGLTTFLRQRFLESDYLGLEFELNYKHYHSPAWPTILPKIIEASVATCRKWTTQE